MITHDSNLFIGGPKDGDLTAVHPNIHFVALNVANRKPPPFTGGAIHPDLTFKQFNYERHSIRTADETFTVWVEPGTTISQVLRLLIEGYRQPKESK